LRSSTHSASRPGSEFIADGGQLLGPAPCKKNARQFGNSQEKQINPALIVVEVTANWPPSQRIIVILKITRKYYCYQRIYLM